MTRLILIDRDGVINQDSAEYIKSPDEWVPIPGSLGAVAKLQRAGFRVAVCTNQAGIGRGLFNRTALEAIHRKMNDALERHGAALDGLVFCPHHPDAQCACRKPRPGMLLEMMGRFHAQPEETWYVGDSVKDAQAAEAAGCHFALVRTGNGSASEQTLRAQGVAQVYDDLESFACSLTGNQTCCPT